MTVKRATAELLRVKLEKSIGGSGIWGYDFLVVDLTDDEGRTAFGFTWVMGMNGDVHLAAARQMLETFVVGKPLGHPQPLWRAIAASLNRTGRGAHQVALAAIDVAAWDLYAKQLGVPLGVAMGGTPRRMPVYGSGGFTPQQSPDEAAAAATDWVRRGARGVKVRAGAPGHDDAGLLQAVAGVLPPGIALMVDANERCTITTARRLLHQSAEVGALWVEEPLPALQLRGYQALAQNSPVTVATGEHLQGCVDAAPWLLGGACGIFQPDLAMMGGLTECLHAAILAEHANVEVAPHFLPSLFIHLAAAAPNITWMEDFALVEPVLAGLPEMDPDGTIGMSDAIGHGLRLADGAREEFAT